MKTRNNDIPLILQNWSRLSSILPLRLSFPLGPGGSQLDFSVCLSTFLLLGTLNAIVQVILVQYVGFPNEKSQQLVAASCVGILHSTIVVAGVLSLFSTRRYIPCEKMPEAPIWWQDACHAVLQFCTGYMIYDFTAVFVNGTIDSSDYPFLAHHIIVVIIITSARMVGAAHSSIMVMILVGEVTNPFQNLYYVTSNALACDCCKHIAWLKSLHYINTFLFCVSYIAVRTLPGWACFCHMTYHWIRHGKANGIPVWLMTFWAVLKWAIAFVSLAWVQDCANMLVQIYFSSSSSTAPPPQGVAPAKVPTPDL
ncbi:hypothetical protein ACA910_020503 [Epithemia clementina (nom. ined.)]